MGLTALTLFVAGCALSATAARGSGDESLDFDRCLSTMALQGSLQWQTPGRPRDGSMLDPWCSAVGPPVLRSASRAAPEPANSLVVITWNEHEGGGDLLRLVDDLESGRLTGGKPVSEFVLLLQEVHRAGDQVPTLGAGARYPSTIRERPPTGERLDIVELASRLNLHILYAPSMRNGGFEPPEPDEDRGNAILSTLPLSRAMAVELPFEAQRRVAVAATISGAWKNGDPWILRVVSGHLDTRSRWSRLLDSFGAGRARQAEALAHSIAADTVVLGADLNTWSAGFLEGARDVLHRWFPTPAPGGHDATYLALGVIPRHLDDLYFRLPDAWTAQVRRLDHRYGSDHFPMMATLHAGGSPEVPAPGSLKESGS